MVKQSGATFNDCHSTANSCAVTAITRHPPDFTADRPHDFSAVLSFCELIEKERQ
jgi:hypothetical protein